MRLLFALPGFHRFDRGAEVSLLAIASELAKRGHRVAVYGSGEPRMATPYEFTRVPSINRERFEKFPKFPPLRNETIWEDITFATSLLLAFRPSLYDAVITCSFPFTHLALRRLSSRKPIQIFVTQNGDWPAFAQKSEYRLFKCDGLVCTNPDYFERNRETWPCALVPNGVDVAAFAAGKPKRGYFGIPAGRPVILMVSAFIDTKRVADGIRATARLPDAHLVVAGDGPLREECERLASDLLPGRFSRVTAPAAEMPALYHSADAFLHMSLLESFGNVFLEAMACGLPIVGHDTARLRWIVGDDQYLCNTERPTDLVAALSTALNRGRGEPSQAVERYAWGAIATKYEAFIGDLLGQNAAGAK